MMNTGFVDKKKTPLGVFNFQIGGALGKSNSWLFPLLYKGLWYLECGVGINWGMRDFMSVFAMSITFFSLFYISSTAG